MNENTLRRHFDDCPFTYCIKNHQLVKRHLRSFWEVPRWLFSFVESILHFIFKKSGFIARNYWTGRLNERFLLYPVYNILIINVRYKIRRQFRRTPRRWRVNCFTAYKYFFEVRLSKVNILIRWCWTLRIDESAYFIDLSLNVHFYCNRNNFCHAFLLEKLIIYIFVINIPQSMSKSE